MLWNCTIKKLIEILSEYGGFAVVFIITNQSQPLTDTYVLLRIAGCFPATMVYQMMGNCISNQFSICFYIELG